MSFMKSFEKISLSILRTVFAGREEALARLDPEKIYVENVRQALGVTTRIATVLCETAVRQGVFVRAVEVRCPDGSVPAIAATEADLPPVVRCHVEDEGFADEVEVLTTTLPKVVFYRLSDPAEAHA